MRAEDWILIVVILLSIIVFLLLLGLIFFLSALHIEKKLPPLMDNVNNINDERAATIKKDIDIIEKDSSLQSFNFDQFEITEEDTLSTMRSKQDVVFIIIRKIIAESGTKKSELLKIVDEIKALEEKSEPIFSAYNKKVMTYNTFIRFVFSRPFAYFAKKTTYPTLH